MTKRICVGVFFLLMALSAQAQKSAQDCEDELGQAAENDRSLVVQCLAESMGMTPDPPRNSKLYVLDFGIANVNSASGVEPYAVFINPNKTSAIKYIRTTMTLYNAVGDQVGSSIGGAPTRPLRFTGPLRYDDGERRVEWDPIWYNSTGECLTMQSLSVEFMNGKILIFSGRTLRAAMSESLSNSCRVR